MNCVSNSSPKTLHRWGKNGGGQPPRKRPLCPRGGPLASIHSGKCASKTERKPPMISFAKSPQMVSNPLAHAGEAWGQLRQKNAGRGLRKWEESRSTSPPHLGVELCSWGVGRGWAERNLLPAPSMAPIPWPRADTSSRQSPCVRGSAFWWEGWLHQLQLLNPAELQDSHRKNGNSDDTLWEEMRSSLQSGMPGTSRDSDTSKQFAHSPGMCNNDDNKKWKGCLPPTLWP